ncbi:MAG: formyl transferase [Eubacterium sp.]|nr:formyl transferase [Eubacterium sp.]
MTNNENALPLFQWISEKTSCICCENLITLDFVSKIKPKLIISYNYNYIIPQDIIDYMHGSIINMHISLLPWNRGFSPNLWSFLDNTPKGVTIHKISVGLDKGELIWQREMFFNAQKETLESTYNKLNEEIVKLFKEHWEEIISGSYKTKEQIGQGSYHSKKQLEQLQEQIPFEWSDCVADVVQKYKKLVNRNESNNCDN